MAGGEGGAVTQRMTTAQYRALPSRAKSKVTPETALKRACIPYLRLQGWLYWPILQQGMMPTGFRGRPDGIAVKNGRHVWLEFKVGNKGLRSDQKLRKAELETAGAMVLIIRRLEDLYVLGDERQLLLENGGRHG